MELDDYLQRAEALLGIPSPNSMAKTSVPLTPR